MKPKHKVVSWTILLAVGFMAFLFGARMTDLTATNLVTFFSVVFGFYMTSIAILYSSHYIKNLHKQIDKKTWKRGTHILKSYLLVSGYFSIFSITSIILFTICAAKDTGDVLSIHAYLPLTFTGKALDLNLLFSSALFGIAALNIYYMLLLMHTIIDGMIEEAKK